MNHALDSGEDTGSARGTVGAGKTSSGDGIRPLAGLSGWLITDGKAGMVVQARGVADALGLAYETKLVNPKGIWKAVAPWGPVAPKEQFGRAGSAFAPPWPAVAIATGRASIPYMRALHKRAGLQTYCIILQDPKTGADAADLIWVPEHDRRRGGNVITTLTSPHSFTAERLAALRADPPAAITALPAPRICVVLGGKNGIYRFTEADDDRLQAALAALGRLGASFMITPSRRTHQRLIRAAEAGTRGSPRILWDMTGDNPYPDFLANADYLVVTADSVNMTGEACATGKPVWVFQPSGGSPKFRRFHEALRAYGATRPLPDEPKSLERWDYRPLDAAGQIAREVERRWSRRRAALPGLLAGSAGG
ncbi:MAG: mitochondrial fission ELM1 family protein [Hyphomicrobiaceae bacterium]